VTNPNGHFSGDCISAIMRCCHLKFLHALQTDPGYLAHPPTGKAPPQKKIIAKKIIIWLKIKCVRLDNFGLVRKSSPKFSRRRGELCPQTKEVWAQTIDTPKVLVHCKLTQFHMPRGSVVQFSGSFGRWRCWERNFEYLN